MDSIKQRVFTNWNFARFFRLGIGLWMLVWGIQTRDWAIALFSALFIFMALSGTGCCGAQGCAIPDKKVNETPATEVDYEEIK